MSLQNSCDKVNSGFCFEMHKAQVNMVIWLLEKAGTSCSSMGNKYLTE